VFVGGTAPGSDLPERFDPGVEFYVHYKESSQLIDGIFGFGGGTSTFRSGDRVERIRMAWPTNDMYATLRARPQLGRLPRAEDRDDAVVISDALWSTWFGRDSSIIGKSYFVSDSMKQVIGIMPPDFHFPDENTLLWVSGEVQLAEVEPGGFGFPLVARMKPGVTTEQLASELTRLSKELPDRFGGPPRYAGFVAQHRALVDPMLELMVGPVLRTSLLVLMAAVAVVLLIACVNVANLFLVRAESRRRDLTVRRAIGATRLQLVRFQMTEVFTVALVAGMLAALLNILGLPLVLRGAPEGIPRLAQIGLDLPTVGAAFALVVLATLGCGIVPAIRASAPDLANLREAGRGAVGGRSRARDLLVAMQTALALLLLIGSALLVQSFMRLRHVDAGYKTEDIYTFQYAPEQPQYNDGPSFGQLHLAFMERLRALPGVTGVGVVNNIPLDEGTPSLQVLTDGMTSDDAGTLVHVNFTGGDYFDVMGIPLLRGRRFEDREAVTPNANVIVSRSTAEKLWPGRDPIGMRVRPRFDGQDTLAFTVVGVVGDVKQDDWRQPGESVMYFPLTGPSPDAWGMGSPAYVVKSPRAESLTNEVRALVRTVAPEAPVYREYTMAFLARRSMLQLSFTTLTLGVVSALALILGAVGLYGVLAYVVAQRTREIGLRMALGATAGAVRLQVVSQGTRVVLVGIVVGVAAALISTKWLAALLYEVRAVEPGVFAAMSLIMLAIGALASYIPAWRASSVHPVEALRAD
jgi:predicted permease